MINKPLGEVIDVYPSITVTSLCELCPSNIYLRSQDRLGHNISLTNTVSLVCKSRWNP